MTRPAYLVLVEGTWHVAWGKALLDSEETDAVLAMRKLDFIVCGSDTKGPVWSVLWEAWLEKHPEVRAEIRALPRTTLDEVFPPPVGLAQYVLTSGRNARGR